MSAPPGWSGTSNFFPGEGGNVQFSGVPIVLSPSNPFATFSFSLNFNLQPGVGGPGLSQPWTNQTYRGLGWQSYGERFEEVFWSGTAVAPEPATLILLGGGLLAAGVARRMRERKRTRKKV